MININAKIINIFDFVICSLNCDERLLMVGYDKCVTR